MKHTIWMVVLASMFVAAGPLAAEPAGSEGEIPTVEQMEHLERALELEAQKGELEHEQQMRELDIEARKAEIENQRRGGKRGNDGGGAFLLLILVINILLTVWVCKDMREQGIGRALWVPIVLLAGVFGAILYAIVRLADTRAKPAGRAKA